MKNGYPWRPGVVLLFAILSATPGWAQDGLTSSQTRQDRRFGSADLMLPDFAPGSSADDDLGVQMILQPDARYEPFTVNAWAGYYFTDNANLVEEGRREDHVFNSLLSVSWLPVIRGNLYGEATLREQTFRYNALSDLDFDAWDAGTGLVYVLRSLGDVSVFTRYNYAEFRDPQDGYGDIYASHSLQAGFFKSWVLSREQFLYASWLSDVALDGDPGYAERHDHSATFGYRITPVRKVKAEVFYRSAFLDYSEQGREDWNHAAGGSVSYNFTPNLYLSAYATFSGNQSNLNVGGDYEAWQTGLRLGGYWRF